MLVSLMLTSPAYKACDSDQAMEKQGRRPAAMPPCAPPACRLQRRRRHTLAPFDLNHSLQVDEALANWDDEMELEEAGSDAEAEDEPMQERSGRAAKAARRGWGRCTAAGPKPLDPAAFSDLLAAAPRLVDLLLEEDKARGCCRGPVALLPAPWGRCSCLVHAVRSRLLPAQSRSGFLLQIRSITLVARDVCNLAIAGGGRISVAPIWSALATRLR